MAHASKFMFRNIAPYCLDSSFAMSATSLAQQLEAQRFQPCGPHEPERCGFVPPVGSEYEPLVHATEGNLLISLQEQKRILPASVVKDEVAKRVAEIEHQENRTVGKKEKRTLKEVVIDSLLPKAFLKTSQIRAWLDTKNHWLVVEANSFKKAEKIIETLNKALSELPIHMLNTERSPESSMAEWLMDNTAPAGFTIDRDCELRSPIEEKAAVRYSHHSLELEEIREHLTDGKRPTMLAMTFEDRVSFTLTDKGTFKGLKVLDLVTESNDSLAAAESVEEMINAEFLIMAAEYSALLGAVVEALGGKVKAS